MWPWLSQACRCLASAFEAGMPSPLSPIRTAPAAETLLSAVWMVFRTVLWRMVWLEELR